MFLLLIEQVLHGSGGLLQHIVFHFARRRLLEYSPPDYCRGRWSNEYIMAGIIRILSGYFGNH